ncbi:hypothetical protein ANANG_G00314490 [Anguilla anguilla]|uniref:Decorin n=1 Tax=Anguilla anguilla TaxID=7936 RepID=A0A9D3LIG8_ANGAN|nr:hypothetical protein ANANG_G00314490 [Anguilla anguilla]
MSSRLPFPCWILGATHTFSPQTQQHRPVQPHSSRMKSACLFLLLASACWALPFRQSGFMDFMMEDEPGSGLTDSPTDPPRPTGPTRPQGPKRPTEPEEREDPTDPFFPGPVCPFRCQCHLRVTQCSDLGLKNVPDKIPPDTSLLDLQNNKISEIRENDFKALKGLHALILVNNVITIIHPKAFMPLGKLQRLYLSKNLLKDMPANMPKSLQELRIHENKISKIKKASFQGLVNVIVMELGSNPLKSSGIDDGAFADLKRVSYIRIADTNLTELPKGLPSSLSELHLDSNKITKVQVDRLKGLKTLAKLGLSFNEISLPDHKYIQVVYLHNNKIAAVGTEDFCPPGFNTKKAMYSGISLFSNPVPYWEVQPITFRCVFDRSAIQLGNYRK